MNPKLILILLAMMCSPRTRALISEGPNHFRSHRILLENNDPSHKDIKQSIGDQIKVTVTLENGPVSFTMEKWSFTSGQLKIEADNVVITAKDLIDLEKPIETEGQNPRVGFAAKMQEYLSRAELGQVISSRTVPISLNVEDAGGSTRRRFLKEERSLQSSSCPVQDGGFVPVKPQYSDNTFAATCPEVSTQPQVGEGSTCMCPYNGMNPRYAEYDVLVNGVNKPYKWLVRYGSATKDCLGRCGPTCNSWDLEAFKDCFDHDLCLSHAGGSVLLSNPNCGNEFNSAADDYVVSYGWSCCDSAKTEQTTASVVDAGSIAGIAIGTFAGILLVIAVAFRVRKNRLEKPESSPNEPASVGPVVESEPSSSPEMVVSQNPIFNVENNKSVA